MQHILITGANRGIGFGLVQEYLRRSQAVIYATCRDPKNADQLNALQHSYPDRVVMIQLEVTDSDSIEQAVRAVQKHTQHLDLLINNAGVNPPSREQTLEALTPETVLRTWQINAMGPFFVTRAFLDLLKASGNARVIMVSSQLGSLTNRKSGGTYAYCSSKAALNMLTRGLAVDLRPHNITTVTIHPGWVRTDMGGNGAPLPTEQSVEYILRLIDNLSPQDNGRFINYDGNTHPW